MDPTALPTDNLYKFMALAGLALAGFCVWLLWKTRDDTLAKLASAFEDLAKVQPLVAAKDRTPEQAESVAAMLRGAAVVGHTKSAGRRSKVFMLGIAAGILVSGTGFGLWYYRLQQFTDAQTKADFEDHMQELDAKRIARERAAQEVKP